ncbi:hypothetical protein SAMN05216486_12310 [bacterium JGI 053]|nr:hypothetical protein SAMN05216486_12310 [bacterium JGI 053]
MQHCMAIGADRSQIFDRIYLITITHCVERNEVMDVYVPSPHCSIECFELKVAYRTHCTVAFDTLCAGGRLPLVSIHRNAAHSPLGIPLGVYHLFGSRHLARDDLPDHLDRLCLGNADRSNQPGERKLVPVVSAMKEVDRLVPACHRDDLGLV